MRHLPGVTLVLGLSLAAAACPAREHAPEVAAARETPARDPSAVQPAEAGEVAHWPNVDTQPEPLDHVVVAGDTVLHASPRGAEVARLPRGRPLGLRVLSEREGWIVATPSHESCVTRNTLFRHVELELAVPVAALVPVSLERLDLSFADATRLTIARGAPLHALGDQRFELRSADFSVELELPGGRTGARHHPGTVHSGHKPRAGFAWDWRDPLALVVGEARLHPVDEDQTLRVELVDETARLVRSARACVDVEARVVGEGELPPRTPLSPPPGASRERLPPGTALYWPTGEVAGRLRASVEVSRVEGSTAAETGRCYAFDPLTLCTRGPSEPSSKRVGSQ
ncbi:hypothetical protein G6O69_07735 [Pseudenhygromyxa sp. WMMC2535]|uniref:hypothetical protein n=1 Tax=Pseudenhygromyxa sp. WMMC2535 TaxID=2712867 RepID=UPI001554D45F|nr:hypothetical protein [Pseudenhygromyxa sp. WMMC2535]NVB37720.1 hypothetical protein [Pseudenhygromyxa sp. WMMC2535]